MFQGETSELRVALPLGVGDVHWVCQKLSGLREAAGRPIRAFVNVSRWHDSVEYLKLVPFVDQADRSEDAPFMLVDELPPHHGDARWSTLEGCRGWRGFDYVLQANGHLERGDRIETWLPELPTMYSYPLNIPEEERQKARVLVPDRATLLYFSGIGPNLGFHGCRFTPAHWTEIIGRLNSEGIVPTIVGAPTIQDREYRSTVLEVVDRAGFEVHDVVGKTTLPMICDIIQRASVWMGLNCGLGIVSAMQGTPTVMFWGDSRFRLTPLTLHTNMRRSWLHESQLETYRTLSYGDPEFTPALAVQYLKEVYRS